VREWRGALLLIEDRAWVAVTAAVASSAQNPLGDNASRLSYSSPVVYRDRAHQGD